MSHLQRVIEYRDHLTALGVTCAHQQHDLCQEAYIRALVSNHAKYHDGFSIGDDEEAAIWERLEKWNAVSPIKSRLILESMKLRLARIRQGLIKDGITPTNAEFDINAEVKQLVEGVEVAKNICVTSNPQFGDLFSWLLNELGSGYE